MKIWIKSVCFVFVFAVVMAFANQAKAGLLPWLSFGSTSLWDATTLTEGSASSVSGGKYNNGDNFTDGDFITGSNVYFEISFDNDANNDWFTVDGWFTADVVNLDNSIDPTAGDFSVLLDNVTPGLGVGSQWWDEFSAAIDPANTYDGQLTFTFSGYEEDSYLIYGAGGVASVPEVVINPEPGTIALLGIGLAGLVGVGVRRRMKKKVD